MIREEGESATCSTIPSNVIRNSARAAGICYLLHFIVGAVALFASSKIIVRGDAAATANNLLLHQSLWRTGSMAHLLVPLTYVAVTALLYITFRHVNRTISVLAACFSLAGCAVLSAAWIFYSYPLSLLNAAPLSGFSVEQTQALGVTLIRMHNQAFNSSMVFFGCYCILLGFLVYRSGMLPRTIGLLLGFAGLAWLTFLFPAVVSTLSPYVLLPGFAGEGSLTLWLLFRRPTLLRPPATTSESLS